MIGSREFYGELVEHSSRQRSSPHLPMSCVRETIALGCERCRFCQIIIDQNMAEAAAGLMDRVNLACSETDDIRAILPGQRPEIVLLRSRSHGEIYLLPFLLVRWWIRFGTLSFEDDDLVRAKHDMRVYSFYCVGGLAILVIFLLFPVLRRLLN